MNKKWMILTCFFSIITLISSIICSCLVFYNEEARTTTNSNKVLASEDVIKNSTIIYNSDNTFKLSGINPGYTIEKTFTVTNNNSNRIIYNIEWDKITSTWNSKENGVSSKPEELRYNVICSNGETTNEKQAPLSNKDKIILENLELNTNSTNTCKIRMTFLNKNIDQSYNNNRLFRGTFKVVIKE